MVDDHDVFGKPEASFGRVRSASYGYAARPLPLGSMETLVMMCQNHGDALNAERVLRYTADSDL